MLFSILKFNNQILKFDTHAEQMEKILDKYIQQALISKNSSSWSNNMHSDYRLLWTHISHTQFGTFCEWDAKTVLTPCPPIIVISKFILLVSHENWRQNKK